MSFWGEFWPALAAGVIGTLLGAGLGIPAGLALDRVLHNWRTRTEQRQQKQIVQIHLSALKEETTRNRSRLESLLRDIKKLPIGVMFEAGAWGAIPAHLAHIAPPSVSSTVTVLYYWLNKVNGLQAVALNIWGQAFDIAGPDEVGNKTKLLRTLFQTVEGDTQEATRALEALERALDESLGRSSESV